MFYARYMDDFISFTETRLQLHKAIKSLHEFLTWVDLKHPRIRVNLDN